MTGDMNLWARAASPAFPAIARLDGGPRLPAPSASSRDGRAGGTGQPSPEALA